MPAEKLQDASTVAPVAWEETACLHCESRNYAPLLEAPDAVGDGLRFLIVHCRECGLCFTNPRPDLATIDRFYPADYHCHVEKAGTTVSEGRLARLGKLLPPRGPARLLDFGCGAGGMLRNLAALGWNVTGLDSSLGAVGRVRDSGLLAHVGTLPSARWTAPCFEAITMWQSLEHVHQPLDVLAAAHALLTPGGKLLVTVPNIDSFAAQHFGSAWFGLDLPRHLTHFTPTTLRAMLHRAGFDAVELWQQRRSGWIRHSAKGRGLLATRLGSSLASWWGWWTRRADSIGAIATKLG